MMVKQFGPGMPLVLYNLVVIGASAGGIEALSTVLGALSKDFAAPIVVAQHLDPARPSHLDAILARRSSLTVRLVTDAAPLLPATVYVVPSDRDIEITDHEVRVQASGGTPSNPSINRLLSSAARTHGERLIAVILTGTGSDGADGAREVSATGGLVIVENPDTAAFPGMPRSLAPTTVDIVADLEKIGPLLGDLLAGTYVPTSEGIDYLEDGSAADAALAQLLAKVRQQSGIDLSGYRRPTILRRLHQPTGDFSPPHLAPARADGWRADEEASQLLYHLPVGVVVVDQRYHIQMINSAALRLLDIYRPAVGEDVVHLAERVPAQRLRRIIDSVFDLAHAGAESSGAPEVVTFATGLGERRDVEIAAYPYLPHLRGERTASRTDERVEMVLLLVSDVTSAVAAHIAAQLVAGRNRSAPEQVLQRQSEDADRLKTQAEQVTTINRQLVEANQELARANLELQRGNGELLLNREQEQASAEEIRTLNEELQASNEELETVNEELQATFEELHSSNDDLAASTQEARELADTSQQQRQASEAEQARLTAILLSLGDAVLVVDSTGTPLLTNTAYLRLFGDASSPIAARDAQGDSLPFKDTPEQCVARGETFVMEFTLHGEDGMRRYFEATGQPINSREAALGGVIAIRDITERSFHRFQDEFLALASHELRTPLTPLLTYLQLLEKLFAREPQITENSSAHDYLTGALNQVQHLRRLTQDLVDVRRLQHGSFSLKSKRVRLEQVVAESVAQTRMAAPEGQKIELEHPKTALLVDGDALRLEQVLVNLLNNALIYAPHSPRLEVRLQRDGDEAVVYVQDSGPGIPAADLTHVFERFYQHASTPERPSRRGLGLGLYIAHALVEAHGGRLEVSSVLAPHQGHGTTFTIHLPLAPPDASERLGQEPPSNQSLGRGSGTGLRIRGDSPDMHA